MVRDPIFFDLHAASQEVILAALVGAIVFMLFANSRPEGVSGLFHWLQRLSAAFVSYYHGQNDAQKTMGVITLALMPCIEASLPLPPSLTGGFFACRNFRCRPRTKAALWPNN